MDMADNSSTDENGSARSGAATTILLPQQAPAADPSRTSPVAERVVHADGGSIIVFTFAPGQSMPEHNAAHPITVQCISGHLNFTVGGESISLDPGVVLHLDARVPHDVSCPENVTQNSVMLLTMLTGETVTG